jgi:hypothetical protein
MDDFLRILAASPGDKVIDFNLLLRPAFFAGHSYSKDSRRKAAAEFKGDILKEGKVLESIQGFLRRNMDAVARSNGIIPIQNIINLLEFMRSLNMEPDLWESQNLYFDLTRDNSFLTAFTTDHHRLFQRLGRALGFVTEET